ncbi:MAG TPA: hypothetical protein PK257_03695 [Candidatus Woesebacteria bacterium]|nr:hypothetical protein [Candidatus Woesebacteria bacterium]
MEKIKSQDNTKQYFLHIEGMDLAGKSTVANKIADKSVLEWVINNKKLNQSNPLYDFAIEQGKKNIHNSDTMGYLYLIALIEDLRIFKHETNIIQDSTLLLRSLNYYKTLSKNDDLVDAFTSLVPKHPKPDKSFYLTADIDTRRNRLENRISSKPKKITTMDMLIKNDPEKFIRLDKSLMDLSVNYFNSYVIDTSKMSETEVVEKMMDICSLRRKP